MKVKDVTQSIFEILVNRIIIGQLKDGERLNENQLASEHSISRGPLREAFRLLENEGLVTSIPRKGTFVKELKKRDIKEVFQVREMVECFAIDLIKKNNLKDFQLLDTPLISNENLPSQEYDDPALMLPILMDNFRFHVSIVAASGNSILINHYQTITSISARCQFKYPYSKEALERAHTEHSELAALLHAEDYDEAKEFLKNHLHSALTSLLNNYDMEHSSNEAMVSGLA